jgi:hypothetical protein
MTIGRFTPIVVCMIAVIALAVGAPVAAQTSTAPTTQSAPATSSRPSTPANSQDAYTLPPDILAKAVALGRIRNFENLAGSVWGILFLWILLATRGWRKRAHWEWQLPASAQFVSVIKLTDDSLPYRSLLGTASFTSDFLVTCKEKRLFAQVEC